MANFLKSLFVKGIEIDPDGATSAQVLSYNGTKFVPVTNSATATTDASALTSGTLDNARLPAAATNITSVGTLGSLAVTNGVTAATFTGALTGTASGNLVSGGALGTPSSGTLTNCTFPTLNQNTTGNAATVTTNANLTGGVTSVGNATTVVTNANLTGGVTSVGNAATVITNANLTGDVTSVGNATTIGANKVTRSMLAATEQMPVGTILMWAGGSTTTATYTTSDVPDGFLLCDGTAVSRSTYSTLFTNLDIRYGNGDGSTTFNLPNLIAFAPVGSKTASAKTSGIRGNANAVATSITTTGATSGVVDHSHTLTGSNSTASNIGLSGNNSTASNIGLSGNNASGSNISLQGSNSTTGNIGLTGSNSTASNLSLQGVNSTASNIGHAGHSHKYQKPTSNYFETDTGGQSATVVTGSNAAASTLSLGGSNAAASNLSLTGSNALSGSLSLAGNNSTASNIAISGSNATASNIAISGSNATASNFSAAATTSGNTTAHSHTISGHAVVYIIKF